MQSQPLPVTELFRERLQYLIPLFQRGYVWRVSGRDRAQVRYLWEDIIDRVDAYEVDRRDREAVEPSRLRPIASHFLGAIVLGPKQRAGSGLVDGCEVIDGQQRLTTLQLMLLALRDVTVELDDDVLASDLKLWTVNPVRDTRAADRLKVLPTNVGRADMLVLAGADSPEAVVSKWPAAAGERPPMVQAYLYFAWIIRAHLAGHVHDEIIDQRRGKDITRSEALARAVVLDDIPPPSDGTIDVERAWALHETLSRHLEVIELRLGESDDPQVIFETLNARGEPLRPSDLIRNFLFLEAARTDADVDRLYADYWQRFDEERDDGGAPFWQQEQRQGRLSSARLDVLLYNVATMRLAQRLKIGHVFESFKIWWQDDPARDVEIELARIDRLAAPMRTIFAPDRSSAFGRFCRRMQLLDTATHVPLLLAFVERHGEDSEEVRQLIGDLESYCVRRFVCGLPTNAYNTLFSEQILRQVNTQRVSDPALPRELLLSQSAPNLRWPDDKRFGEAWRTARLYQGNNTSRVQAILWGLEEALGTGRQEYVLSPEGVTVEHVLPQRWNEDDHPFSDSEDEARDRRDDLVHSIGNLTLVTGSFNAELSNRSFAQKRPALARESALRLNADFQDADDCWTELEIRARADRLFETALAKWPRPSPSGLDA